MKIHKKKTSKEILSERIFKFIIDKSKEALEGGLELIINPSGMQFSNRNIASFFRQKEYFKRSPYFGQVKGGYQLTGKGRIKVIKSILMEKLNKEAKWNGFWWAVVFDIPEKRRNIRELLRRELKMMHFVEIQKSIWITPYNIEKELFILLKLWTKDFTGNIKVLKIEKILDDKELKEYFEIK